MKKFNINHNIYIQITTAGWKHLQETVGTEYIKHCINRDSYRVNINGEVWYKLQAHHVFSLFEHVNGFNPHYNTNILIDDTDLEVFDTNKKL